MNGAFIWLSRHRFIDREIFNGWNFFPEFSLKIIPHGDRKKYNMPEAKGLTGALAHYS